MATSRSSPYSIGLRAHHLTPRGVVADDADDREPETNGGVELEAVEPERAVAVDDQHPLVRVGKLGGEGERHADAERAERTGVHPGARWRDPSTLEAWATMSPPSPMTIIGSSVSTKSAISRHSRSGSIGTSSLSSWRTPSAASASSSLIAACVDQSEKSSAASLVSLRRGQSRLAPRLPTRPTSAARF